MAQAREQARKSGAVIVTEGYTDVIAMAEAGFANVVAPLGTALTEDQIGELWKLAPEPVLCFDGDNAGQRAAARAAERALPLLRPGFSLRFAVLPPGEDPDSLINKSGPQAMAAALAGAAPLSEVLWRMETGGRAVSTPEERASLQKRMEDHARRIDDALVRRHFLDAIRERLRPKRYVKGGAKRIELTMAPPLGSLSAAGHADPADADRKILIAGIINHPNLFHMIEDEIGRIGFGDQFLDMLRQAIVSILSSDHDIVTENLKAELERRGFSETLDAIFNDPLIRKNSYIKPGAPEKNVLEGWNQILRRIRSGANALEVESMKGADIDRQEWERLLMLKKASLEDDDE
ncbi:MAG: hypothetical protein A3H92_11635 [Rhodospirillales bacterium RIFCSPLOWO2_02_FULL_58_16]|nr:MAG: hypothetical protein A3H92_11635 [Rhodospirillales bacterium RIFCSPLOWO2_02_FULL_58_16]